MLTYNAWILQNQWGIFIECTYVTAAAAMFFFFFFPSQLLQGAQLRKHIDATLGSGNLWEAVKLPPGEDLNEWLAVNSNYHSL